MATDTKVNWKAPKGRCGMWDGQQCRATAKLQGVVIASIPGSWLKVPAKVVVNLCPKHFSMAKWTD